MKLTFILLKDIYAICKFNADLDIPSWIEDSGFYSITRTDDELSIVCKQASIKDNTSKISKDWRILKISGPLDFSLIGITADISGTLSRQNIPIFTISTYETDYILVKSRDLNKSTEALIANGHIIISDDN